MTQEITSFFVVPIPQTLHWIEIPGRFKYRSCVLDIPTGPGTGMYIHPMYIGFSSRSKVGKGCAIKLPDIKHADINLADLGNGS